MRRNDREITDPRIIKEILNNAEIVHLAMVDDSQPYLVVMNFAYHENSLYLHSAKEGRKIDVLKKNGNVAFLVETNVKQIIMDDPCKCSTKYESVFGTGYASFIDSDDEKTKALNLLMLKHTGKANFQYSQASLNATLIIKVEITSLTAKKAE